MLLYIHTQLSTFIHFRLFCIPSLAPSQLCIFPNHLHVPSSPPLEIKLSKFNNSFPLLKRDQGNKIDYRLVTPLWIVASKTAALPIRRSTGYSAYSIYTNQNSRTWPSVTCHASVIIGLRCGAFIHWRKRGFLFNAAALLQVAGRYVVQPDEPPPEQGVIHSNKSWTYVIESTASRISLSTLIVAHWTPQSTVQRYEKITRETGQVQETKWSISDHHRHSCFDIDEHRVIRSR